ncbi:MAG: PAS domain S-box protein [Leptothrix sp. (in: b-proteobacteria)]
MQPAPLRDDEQLSLAALRALDVLDSDPEAEFDALVRAASIACGAPISLISLIDTRRQWFKANTGLPGVTETPRDLAFCAHAVLDDALFEVADATADARFADNPLVTEAPHIRFYAGAPIALSDGHRVGTLCVIDRQPRNLNDTQRELLRCLAVAAARALEGRRAGRELQRIALANEERLRRLYEATPAMLHSIDPQGRLLMVSDRWLATMGYRREEVIGRPAADFLNAESRERARSVELPAFLASGRCDQVAYQMITRTGEVLDVQLSASLERDAQGRPLRSFTVVEDVTQRLRAERALRKSESFLERTGRAAGVGGWELDLISGEVTWSSETRRIHGVAPDYQPTLATAIAFYAPEARPVIQAAVEQAMHTGAGWDLELQLDRIDGVRIWVRAIGAADFVDGRPVRLAGAFQDITERHQLQLQLMATAKDLFDLYNHAPCAYYSLDAQGRFLNINSVGLAWMGCGRAELIGKLGSADFLTEEGREMFEQQFQILKTRGHVDGLECDLVSRDGTVRRVSVSASAVTDRQGGFVMSRTVMHDITESHRLRNELTRHNRRQAAMLDNDLVGIVRLRQRIAIWKNRAIERIFGYSHAELQGQSTRMLYVDDASYEALGVQAYPTLKAGQHYRTQLQMRRKDGELVWIDLSGVMISAEDGESLWMMIDITAMKHYQQQVEHIAFHDTLTGLPNRLLLSDRLNQALQAAQRLQHLLAVAYLDLDGFKQVNDRHGHEAGDRLLREVARRIGSLVRGSDTAARLGGDEFVILLSGLASREQCRMALDRLLAAIQEPIEIDAQTTVQVAGSMGVALYPVDAQTSSHLLTLADTAMYEAKRAGRSQIRFHVSVPAPMPDWRTHLTGADQAGPGA